MARTDETGGASGADLDQITQLADHIKALIALIERYEQRERLKPKSEIAGGSLSLLINLYRTSIEWLPPGAVADSVTEVLTSRDMHGPDRLILSDELDLLTAVVGQLQGVASKLLKQWQLGQRRSAAFDTPRGSHPQRDQDQSSPSSQQYREKRASNPRSIVRTVLADYV
jgi:hypothetical protein